MLIDWLEMSLTVVDGLTPVKRIEFGFVLLHVAYLIANQRKINSSVLIEICKLFAVDANIEILDSQLAFIIE